MNYSNQLASTVLDFSMFAEPCFWKHSWEVGGNGEYLGSFELFLLIIKDNISFQNPILASWVAIGKRSRDHTSR